MGRATVSLILVAFVFLLKAGTLRGQQLENSPMQLLRELGSDSGHSQQPVGTRVLDRDWAKYPGQAILPDSLPYELALEETMLRMLNNSANIAVMRFESVIQETVAAEERAQFDWQFYLDSIWNDSSEPTSSILTAGQSVRRLNEHDLNGTVGVRRRVADGSTVDLSQRLGHRNSNSEFFLPNNQGNARLSLEYTKPILRGNGVTYNQATTVIAQLNVNTAENDFATRVSDQLLRLGEAYWRLYQERAILCQRTEHYSRIKKIQARLQARMQFDGTSTGQASVDSALATIKSQIYASKLAVRDAETVLKTLINSKGISETEGLELITTVVPELTYRQVTEQIEMEKAFRNRTEIHAAIHKMKSAAVRYRVSSHDLMPMLNLITSVYLAGLAGDSEVQQAWFNQFHDGAPGYSVGLQMEVPIGNRQTMARLRRRELELVQATHAYREQLERIRGDVELAVRGILTSQRLIDSSYQAVKAAELEVESFQKRWQLDLDQNQSKSYTLLNLLQSEQRVLGRETELLNAIVNHQVSELRLKRANGTLFKIESLTNHIVETTSTHLEEAKSKNFVDMIERFEITTYPVASEWNQESTWAKPVEFNEAIDADGIQGQEEPAIEDWSNRIESLPDIPANSKEVVPLPSERVLIKPPKKSFIETVRKFGEIR